MNRRAVEHYLGLFFYQAIERFEVGHEPEEETGYPAPKAPVGRAHPRRLLGLLGHVDDARLKAEGLVQTVDDLAL